MRDLQEIMNNPRICVDMVGADGFHGTIATPTWMGSIICSKGGGWEHVSVSPRQKRHIPSWDDMCLIKNICWNEDEEVIQIHPAKADYVNNLPNCLHLWRCYYKDMVLPLSCMVGLRQGQTMSEIVAEMKQAYEMAGEVYR